MLDKIKKFTLQMMVGANIATIIVMLITGFCYRLNPQEHPIMANMGLAFPVPLIVNAAFLVVFLVVKRRLVVVPILGFVACYIPVRIYTPLNVPHSAPEDAIKVMSYNVFFFNNADGKGMKQIADYVNGSGAAIVCMQEAKYDDDVIAHFKDSYKYMDTLRTTGKAGEVQLVLSKYPILSKSRINTDLKGCLCGAYEILIDGDRTTVINCHLEGSGLSLDDRQEIRNFVKGGWKSDTIATDSKRMIVRLGESSARRVPQVEGIIKYIKSRKDEPVLFFGDMNDNPLSYCHSLMAHTLTDCYEATANGPGISYHYNAIYVRIDNIMCSSHWQPYNFKVDRQIAVSDHYPIWGYVKKSQLKGKKSPR